LALDLLFCHKNCSWHVDFYYCHAACKKSKLRARAISAPTAILAPEQVRANIFRPEAGHRYAMNEFSLS
jgi:hypothetical protein